MPKLTIDGKEIEVADGTTVFEAARQADISIPHFCYHPKLSIAGNCRMCLVDIEKMPKPAISCNTVANEGMVVNTKTEKVKELQKSVLEFILINHPIDCPVCDQAGECKLQEFYMDYTMTDSEFHEEKVKKPKKVDLGPNVMLDDERCILCSRCIRFCDEITHTSELCFSERGDRSTLTTFPGKQLDNKYSLNTVDICPVGALTSKPFRFQKRVWFLKHVPSVCSGCATGCNIYMDYDDGKVWRYRTRDNESVNQCWTCDAGRLSYPLHNEKRVTRPMVRKNGVLEYSTISDALGEIARALSSLGGDEAVLVGSAQESNENNMALKKFGQTCQIKDLQYSAKPKDDADADNFLIKADKNPNRAGVQHLGYQEFHGGIGVKVVLALEGFSETHLSQLREEGPVAFILLATHLGPETELADVVLPAATFGEQEGSFTNFQNRVQKFEAALIPQGMVLPAWKWLEKIAQELKQPLQLSAEALLQEGFGLKFADLGTEGKILESKN